MEFYNISQNQSYSELELRYAHPNVSFPAVLTKASIEDFGFVPVLYIPPPVCSNLEVTIRDGVEVDILGNYVTKWKITPRFTEYTENDIIYTQQAQEAEYLEKLAKINSENIRKDIINSTQLRLDQFAQTRGYDNILSACSYATSPTPKFAAEGQYCVAQRDATWAKLLEILAEVESGSRPLPAGYSNIESELPTLAWD